MSVPRFTLTCCLRCSLPYCRVGVSLFTADMHTHIHTCMHAYIHTHTHNVTCTQSPCRHTVGDLGNKHRMIVKGDGGDDGDREGDGDSGGDGGDREGDGGSGDDGNDDGDSEGDGGDDGDSDSGGQ